MFRAYYGPVHKAFAALDTDGQAALERDLLALLQQSAVDEGPGFVVRGEYLEAVIRK